MENKIKIYSANDLKDLMASIGDDQYLHNSQEMAKLGKLAIVPGVAIQSFALNDILTSMSINSKVLDITKLPEFNSLFNFGLPFSQDDEIKFSYEQKTKNSARIKAYISDDLETDRLSSGENYSTLSLGVPIIMNPSHFKDYVIDDKNVAVYAKAVGIKNLTIAKMLYTMSFASKVLLDAVEEKNEDVFNQVKAEIEKRNLPTYSSIETHMQRPFDFDYKNSEMPVSFGVSAVKEGKRGYQSHITCDMAGKRVYESEAVLTVVPESIILGKMAKNIK